MADQQLLGRFELGSTADWFTVENATSGVQNVSLTTGYYYISGYTGEATEQLCEHIQTTMQAISGFTTANCTYSSSTGKITLDFAATTNVVWEETALRDLLGFTASDTMTGASSYTGSNEAQYVWRPDRPLTSSPLTPKADLFEPESTSILYRSRDGTTTSLVGSQLYRASIDWQMLSEDRVLIPDTGSVNQELEQFFNDVIHQGQPIRLYYDRSVNTSTDYVTVLVSGDDEGLGSFSDFATRAIRSYNGLWDVTLPFWKHVS